MKADLRISIKDYRRGKTLRVTLARVPFGPRQLLVFEGIPPHPGPLRGGEGGAGVLGAGETVAKL